MYISIMIQRVGWFLLNVMQATFTTTWTLVWVCAALIVLVVTMSRKVPLIMARRIWSAGLLWGARARLDVRGLENVDFSRPHVFVANHESMIDIPVMFRAIPVNLHFIIKKELKYVPLVGWYAWAMGMVFVDRKDRMQAFGSLKRVGLLIRGGRNIIAFPEGTRSRTDGHGVQPFKRGVFVAAIEAGVPVVPVAIVGSRDVLPSDGFRVRAGVIGVRIGKPIATAGMTHADRDRLTVQARDAVAALHASKI